MEGKFVLQIGKHRVSGSSSKPKASGKTDTAGGVPQAVKKPGWLTIRPISTLHMETRQE
jgi:hypothetical protein